MDILLVEDSKMVSWVIKNHLESLGHRVDLAEDGKKAVDLFQRGYDMIFLDICLPVLNGFEVARIIREKEENRNVIVGISTLGEHARKECLASGFNDIYEKPISINDVEEIIEKWAPWKIKRYA